MQNLNGKFSPKFMETIKEEFGGFVEATRTNFRDAFKKITEIKQDFVYSERERINKIEDIVVKFFKAQEKISKEEAEERIAKAQGYSGVIRITKEDLLGPELFAQEALRKVPWINCKENLPEKSGKYEVTLLHEGDEIPHVEMVHYYSSHQEWLTHSVFCQWGGPFGMSSIINGKVIAWRPILSEPYNEKTQTK